MKTVCCVEDDPDLRSDLVDLLEITGIEVKAFETAEECLEGIAGGDDYGLFLLDLTLPGMSGIELVETLRSKGIDCPILVLSGESDIHRLDDVLKRCDVQFCSKPFKFEELVTRVSSFLNESR